MSNSKENGEDCQEEGGEEKQEGEGGEERRQEGEPEEVFARRPVEEEYTRGYLSQADRLATFSNWEVAFISPAELAKAGFFFLRVGDLCMCAFCYGVLGPWEEGDRPVDLHRERFPLCVFLQGAQVEGVEEGEVGRREGSQEEDPPGH